MSTASGLMVSVAGTISFDLWRRGNAGMTVRRRRFRVAALGGVLAPVALALVARGLDISVLVGWAFALAASILPAAAPRHLVGAPHRRGA